MPEAFTWPEIPDGAAPMDVIDGSRVLIIAVDKVVDVKEVIDAYWHAKKWGRDRKEPAGSPAAPTVQDEYDDGNGAIVPATAADWEDFWAGGENHD